MIKKIMLVFGTRPEAIKMVPIIKELEKFPEKFKVTICITGQHREMLDQVLNLFEIIPNYDFNIMKKGQDLYDVTSCVLLEMGKVLKLEQPNLVLVHGDTTTSMAAALASFYQQIPVGHIEAGLRTNDIYNPWPEEINRQITSRITTYHFAPTELSKANLIKENISDDKIIITGNTVIDTLHLVINKIKNDIELSSNLISKKKRSGYKTKRLKKEKKLVLITGHRRENFGDGFINICNAIKYLVEKYPNVDFVYPMHLNPNVREPITKILSNNNNDNIFLIEPLEYFSFLYLMNKSDIILTDSGGIQEEAPSLGKPVLVMRNTTERPEALNAGTVKLVGTDFNKITKEVSTLLENKELYNQMSLAINPYGDGHASERIINYLSL